MNTKSLLVGGVIGLILGPVITFAIFGGFGINSRLLGSNQMMGRIDKHFIEQMIPHHEGAIEMAELALERAKRTETKTLATAIIAAQQKEITDMKNWYKEWYGSDIPITGHHMMNGHMMQGGMTHMDSMAGDIEALKSANDFDLEFAKQMIPHHEMAVMMAQMLQGSTNRSEMKTLAQNIITSQNIEIEMMRGWIKAWSL
jgi:uncharacterized protein (DUF305 family)